LATAPISAVSFALKFSIARSGVRRDP
jgi:hypothetical protein